MNKQSGASGPPKAPKEETFTKEQVESLIELAVKAAMQEAKKKPEKPKPVDYLPEVSKDTRIKVRARLEMQSPDGRGRKQVGDEFTISCKTKFHPDVMEVVQVDNSPKGGKAAPPI